MEIPRSPELEALKRLLKTNPIVAILGPRQCGKTTLARQASESLAGRISYMKIGGFFLKHVGAQNAEKLWIRGGFPRSFLASSETLSYQWRQDFIAAFL